MTGFCFYSFLNGWERLFTGYEYLAALKLLRGTS
ncbi:MAG: hypothetical protein ACI9MF_001483, partial [Gammaproteobacteria bacterium]